MTHRTRIKICGLTQENHVHEAIRHGADALGFVFYVKSPRYVTPQRASTLMANVPPFVMTVGLFVNHSKEEVAAVLAQAPVALLQFHGDETIAQCHDIAHHVQRPFIRTLRVSTQTNAHDLRVEAQAHRDQSPWFSGIVVDTWVDDYGGSGQVFDWDILPKELAPTLILSGGLTVNNITQAIQHLHPFAVDVSSGVEVEKGIKDPQKIKAFIARCQVADGHLLNHDQPGQTHRSAPTPDAGGHFGRYGGKFIPETLTQAVDALERAYAHYQHDPDFLAEFHHELKHFVGRPSPIYHAKQWSEKIGGAQIYFKREDLNHTGAHKINNVIGQALLAKRMGKSRIIAETGAGQHGVATATICARFGMSCVVYMGEEDAQRQQQNVYRMQLLGATVVPVTAGSKTLKDALNEAMRDWVTNIENTFYIIGTVAGPHPYPMMVRDFQTVIGQECRVQMPELTGRQPDVVVACIGGGSNAMGIFYPYIEDATVRLIGVEAGGHGINSGQHAASLTAGSPGVLHGNRTYLLQDAHGQIQATHSISAGLDYPGVGPEHAWLKESGRATYEVIDDDEALSAFHTCCRLEGIIPALESSHALAYAAKLASRLPKNQIVLVNLSGRGDKDIHTVQSLS